MTLFQNTTGIENTGFGWNALSNNTTGGANTAVGVAALQGMNGGSANAAFGESALGNTTTASSNTAIGTNALILDGAGIGLLSYLVATATGKTWEGQVNSEILEPLGMADTTICAEAIP
jgi:hypothetical protein